MRIARMSAHLECEERRRAAALQDAHANQWAPGFPRSFGVPVREFTFGPGCGTIAALLTGGPVGRESTESTMHLRPNLARILRQIPILRSAIVCGAIACVLTPHSASAQINMD